MCFLHFYICVGHGDDAHFHDSKTFGLNEFMVAQLQSICLSMIVKNEAPVICRCLDSVKPLISHWVIMDTGSTDGTQDIIRRHMDGIPGTLYERPWKDFAYNRSEALRLARPHGDYSLIIDADDALEIPQGFQMPPLLSDCYVLNITDGSIAYGRKQIVSNRLNWFYRGVLHEFLESDGPHSTGHLPIVMRRNHDGARRRDPNTYRRDAEVLERALATETDAMLRSRYTFYLAQSYRDCKEPEKALLRYLERSKLGGWQEEVFVSLYQAGLLKEQLGHDDAEVIAAYEDATAAAPWRAEADHAASRLCRVRSRFGTGYAIAKRSIGKPVPAGGLFVAPWIYEYALWDEFAVLAYWCGHYEESLDACINALGSGKLPSAEAQRVAANARFAIEQIRQHAPSKP